MVRRFHAVGFGLLVLAAGIVLTGCGAGTPGTAQAGVIRALAAENEYGNVIQQIGGRYVSVTSIMNNPNVDPHTYEADSQNAIAMAKATLVVQNGAGYDAFMTKLESASANPHQVVIDVAKALSYGPRVKNPHFWYKPTTMPKVALIIARDLARQDPSHRQYFEQHLKKFDRSLIRWTASLTQLQRQFARAPVAVTEPVADYLLTAGGLDIKTPWALQAAIMNGTDPSPQAVQIEDSLLKHRRVKVFVYNRQVVDATTKAFIAVAKKHHIPIVGVYETMPLRSSYQRWMQAEVAALRAALKSGKSTVNLK